MATVYVDSTTGSDTNSGSAFGAGSAFATIQKGLTSAGAGGTVYVASVHSESYGTSQTLTSPGTVAAPTLLICTSNSVTPPTAATTGAQFATTSASNISFVGCLYIYGVKFTAGSGGSSATIIFNSSSTTSCMIFESCILVLGGTTGGNFSFGGSALTHPQKFILKNTTLNVGSTASRITLVAADLEISGGSWTGTAAVPAQLFNWAGTGAAAGADVRCTGWDLSALGSTLSMIQSQPSGAGRLRMSNCKLPASWSGSIFSATPTVTGLRGEMHNCSSGSTVHNLRIEDAAGTAVLETTKIKTSGSNDGTAGYSIKVTTTSNCNYLSQPFHLHLPPIWNTSTGVSKTGTVDILQDSLSATTNAQVGFEIEAMTSGATPYTLVTSSAPSDPVAAASNWSASSASWTTTGLTNPNAQKASVTFTPQAQGYIKGRLVFGAASSTWYVDNQIQVA